MGPTPNGTPEDVRIAAIRLDIEIARMRIVRTIDTLEYKADMPARLADVLSNTVASFTSALPTADPVAGADLQGGEGRGGR